MRVTQAVLSALLLTGIAGFAVSSLISSQPFGTQGNPAALQDADDPVRNGLQIIERRADLGRAQSPVVEGSPIYLLDDYVFTGKGKPSPYH